MLSKGLLTNPSQERSVTPSPLEPINFNQMHLIWDALFLKDNTFTLDPHSSLKISHKYIEKLLAYLMATLLLQNLKLS